MSSVVEKARALMQNGQEAKALELLTPEIQKAPEDVVLLQIFGEALLEVNDVETAYTVLQKATELDPEARLGVEKFLYLGQIVGGRDGVALLSSAIQRLQGQLQSLQDGKGEDDAVLVELAAVYPSSEQLAAYLIKKANEAIFAEIEIWMTDLCDEPEAESQCDQLISHSLSIDAQNPEAHSLLASIRISQQRPANAKQAVQQAWELFAQKKSRLEQQSTQEGEEASFEYVELVQPLLNLTRFALELEMYDLTPLVCTAVAEINDNALDCFYYDALSALFHAKQLYAQANSVADDYRDISNSAVVDSADEAIQACVRDAKSALTQGYRVINGAQVEASDPELVNEVEQLLAELGGPVLAELMPQRRIAEDEEEGWEDEIASDNE